MAAPQKTSEKFIELRSENISFNKIAKQLKVGKTTLLSWAKLCGLDIENLRSITHVALNELYKVGSSTAYKAFAKLKELQSIRHRSIRTDAH